MAGQRVSETFVAFSGHSVLNSPLRAFTDSGLCSALWQSQHSLGSLLQTPCSSHKYNLSPVLLPTSAHVLPSAVPPEAVWKEVMGEAFLWGLGSVQGMCGCAKRREWERDWKEAEGILKEFLKNIVCKFNVWLVGSGAEVCRDCISLGDRSDSWADPLEARLSGYAVENQKSGFCADVIINSFFDSWQASSVHHHCFG